MNRRFLTIERRNAFAGLCFILPFILGFAVFFALPAVQSIIFIFFDIKQVGMQEWPFAGLQNLVYIFTEEPEYNRFLWESLGQMLYQVPVVLMAALFLAVIVNQKFKGRVFVRAVFFLPVIVTSGVIMSIIKNDAFATSLITSSEGMKANISATSFGLQNLLISLGLGSDIVGYFTRISGNLFDLLWRTGIQMIIFLAGLQSISPALYEASSIEGASAWENFWMITFPMLIPMIMVNLVYTVVDCFTDSTNKVMQLVTETGKNSHYSYAAAMAWCYFLIVGAVLAAIFGIYAMATRRKSRR